MITYIHTHLIIYSSWDCAKCGSKKNDTQSLNSMNSVRHRRYKSKQRGTMMVSVTVVWRVMTYFKLFVFNILCKVIGAPQKITDVCMSLERGGLTSQTFKIKRSAIPSWKLFEVIFTLTYLKTAFCVGGYDTFFNVRLKIYFQYTNSVCLPKD